LIASAAVSDRGYSGQRRRAVTAGSDAVTIAPMSSEPESLILELLRQMRSELATKADVEGLRSGVTKGDLNALRSELRSLRADLASDLIATRKELSEQIVGLRRAVMEYHTTVIGHGAAISDLEARVRRVEQHLNLRSLSAG
jgi:hypothetical protein